MTSRRQASRDFKERRSHGGVYTITDTVNGRRLTGHAADLASARNRFQFSVSAGSPVDPRLRNDWAALGPGAFSFAVQEELDQIPEQSREEFLADLQALEQLVRTRFAAETLY